MSYTLQEVRERVRYGYRLGETVYYTSSGTFDKGDYPGLRAVIVEVQGPGGNGGGAAATGASQQSVGGGGGGGGYARSFILVDDLDTSEAVTVGTSGNDSVFDTISGEVRGQNGSNGVQMGAGSTFAASNPGAGGGGTGDFVRPGSYGTHGTRLDASLHTRSGYGGDSMLGGSVRGVGSNDAGLNGLLYGGGGSGACNQSNQSARSGGTGAQGIVIVHLLY